MQTKIISLMMLGMLLASGPLLGAQNGGGGGGSGTATVAVRRSSTPPASSSALSSSSSTAVAGISALPNSAPVALSLAATTTTTTTAASTNSIGLSPSASCPSPMTSKVVTAVAAAAVRQGSSASSSSTTTTVGVLKRGREKTRTVDVAQATRDLSPVSRFAFATLEQGSVSPNVAFEALLRANPNHEQYAALAARALSGRLNTSVLTSLPDALRAEQERRAKNGSRSPSPLGSPAAAVIVVATGPVNATTTTSTTGSTGIPSATSSVSRVAGVGSNSISLSPSSGTTTQDPMAGMY